MERNLFKQTNFTSHSGTSLNWKLECDALTDEDIACIAYVISTHFGFSTVHGIPTGGERLAKALLPYSTPDVNRLLIVDDVMTTGQSMLNEYKKWKCAYADTIGIVIFNRGRYSAEWLYSFMSLGQAFR